MDPDENDIYKFLGVKQAEGIKMKTVLEWVKEEITKRVKMLNYTELNNANLMGAINVKVIPITAFPLNICKFSTRELRAKNMLHRTTGRCWKAVHEERRRSSKRQDYRLHVICWNMVQRTIGAWDSTWKWKSKTDLGHRT